MVRKGRGNKNNLNMKTTNKEEKLGIGTLYVVATPIGNLEDITLRALRVLKEVSLVLCEDTRHTRILFNKYDIKTRTESYHVHSNDAKLRSVSEKLNEGMDIALVSDAGTPLISDPGSPLISYLKKIFGADLRVVAVPGPSALTAALSIIPVPSGRFTFLGFLPHKKGRHTAIMNMKDSGEAFVFYESSHRIVKLLGELDKDYPEAKVSIGRELTKQFEEVLEGSPSSLKTLLEEKPEKQKGEFVVVVEKGV
jgi:16S rRNA (cytidine1402-2'-O)-methyltransferase